MPLRRSTRERRSAIPDDYIVFLQEQEDTVDMIDDDPDSFYHAMQSSDSHKWIEAMNEEYKSIQDNQVWDLVLGILAPVGAPWRNLRRICNSYIFANQKLDSDQDLRRKKIQELVNQVEESCRLGAAVDIGQVAFKAMLNVLSTTIFSLDLSDSDSDIEFKEVVRCIMDEVGKTNLADYFPLLRKIDPQGIKGRLTIHFGVLFDLFDRIIDERLLLRKQQSYIPSNDLLDTLLSLNEDKNENLDMNCIKHLFLDLFAAGTDTTSSTLEWAMTELLRNPKILTKAKAEIEQTVGKGKLIQDSDVDRLAYLQAIIKETFRLHPAVPLLLPRRAGVDVEICGFTVPKDAQVMVNAWAIGRDPSLWEDPDLFMPERFLGSEIDARGRNFELIPFGAGRRICPGLPLATSMLSLILGSLINSFGWKLEDEITSQTMDMEDRFGVTLQKAQPLRAIPLPLQR
ncbi:geraniol 8-hydroxylase [Jatropha curcas]|uniref:geraniol 8-hydroxylase n=1 Tax=Jatropha curcas TaxID=180498 RepID=UPI001894DE50|nr:geraniol 8-hydroxylase [Jatropha curcas]